MSHEVENLTTPATQAEFQELAKQITVITQAMPKTLATQIKMEKESPLTAE